MIVRTYHRRSRCNGRALSDCSSYGDEDSFRESLSQESSQEMFSYPFSSQDSSSWSMEATELCPSSKDLDLWPLPPRPLVNSSDCPKSKKPRTLISETMDNVDVSEEMDGSRRNKGVWSSCVPATASLMEAQEFGEMMEHVDEAYFALDGLRPGQPLRIQRASLLSLLSICGTSQQRRVLRAQGMAKAIFDAILILHTDDSPSTLAAAAIFFVLASDGQDEHLLESSECVKFLLKLLHPPKTVTIEKKVPTIGSKLLAARVDSGLLRAKPESSDANVSAIDAKVLEILHIGEEMKLIRTEENRMRRPELSSKWIALLTLEKACLSTVALEDTSGSVRRVGGKFKERFRELGGLDSIVDVIVDCHSVLEGVLKHSSLAVHKLKSEGALQSLALLLRCFKIIENATFLSKENQNHLLEMNAKLECPGSPLSFVGLILSAIKIISGLILLGKRDSPSSSSRGKSFDDFEELKGKSDSKLTCSLEELYHKEKPSILIKNGMSRKVYRDYQSFSSQTEYSFTDSMTTSSCGANTFSVKEPAHSKEKAEDLNGRISSINDNGVKEKSAVLGKRCLSEDVECKSVDSQDPFAFDEYDMEPSKWEQISSIYKRTSRSENTVSADTELDDGHELKLATRTNGKAVNGKACHVSVDTCSSMIAEEDILDDCLRAAIKVLMNLTNDNSVGCKEIAACGGLDTMAALIVGHFPIFHSSLSLSHDNEDITPSLKTEICDLDRNDKDYLSDHEMELLVAILGVLVNLVEKDTGNRTQLAAASVLLPDGGRSEEGKGSRQAVIPLLCSIFLANQGAGETVNDGTISPWDDEAAILQGEREAEKMIVEAYAALLLAFLSNESVNAREAIARCLPEHNLRALVPVLERFVAFHLTLNMISPDTHAIVCEVIESCRMP
ncbi:uncharacterized protein LOC18423152 isoform X1 [Amborella trichopoda]|uniref:Wings apart-like protein C-terminal domain-containing protein n=1 Tax=Amborella trichopoda TaxID=13333 RepID=W1NIF1_AMBTC|nr:uncharacterized protein LOC18423152 isoform X1 [Amborella trichopoda]ERM95221.1 hypothetical protein AMTR_s00009p00267550 [Amborella trichopoda]|eukprot:XP_006827805.1 uncharacterized protein LOC18423152 isoform X1 [Amborella trichopoda]